MKEVSVKDMRAMYGRLYRNLLKIKGKNKLAEQYRHKLSYMAFWIMLLPCDKTLLDNWVMPDGRTIDKLKEAVSDEK